MSYKETLEYIHSVQWRGSRLGLSRTRELMEKLGSPEKKLKFVHIAGTNGKGSTAACIEAVLRAAGYRTGLYTSPYINRFNERIQICGEPISDQALVEVTERVRPLAEAMEDKPTEFELITAVAMEYFAREGCDIVVLEVGMGGELDSTNVIDTPELAVITAIGLDHTRELGPAITDIAAAKAGIIKAGGDVVIYGGDREADPVFERKCAEKNASLTKTDFSRLRVRSADISGTSFDFGELCGLYLPLAGTYQPKNAALALTALERLTAKGWRISEDNIRRGLAGVRWPGRFEVLRRDPVFILDGAHNPHGVTAAVQSLKACFGGQKIIFISGVMADKDVKTMAELTCQIAERFFTVRPNNPRAMSAVALAEALQAAGAEAEPCAGFEEAVNRAISAAGKDGVVCAMGSLYFSADIRAAVEKRKNV